MATKRLIINADDFGYCAERNRAIIECFKAGAVTSASLLVKGEAAEDGIRQAKEVGLPLGLHLNLTEGRAVCKKTSESTITGDDRRFFGKVGYREKIKSGEFNPIIIKNEIEAQVERFKELYGALPVHVDGHQHCHIVPGVCEIFASVMQHYGIEWIRLPFDHTTKFCGYLPDKMQRFLKDVVTDTVLIAKAVFDDHGLRYPRKYIGMTCGGRAMRCERVKEQLMAAFQSYQPRNDYARKDDIDQDPDPEWNYVRNETNTPNPTSIDLIEETTCEFMVHPGYVAVSDEAGVGSGPDSFAKSPEREQEMNIIMSEEILMFYKDSGYELCSYCDLS